MSLCLSLCIPFGPELCCGPELPCQLRYAASVRVLYCHLRKEKEVRKILAHRSSTAHERLPTTASPLAPSEPQQPAPLLFNPSAQQVSSLDEERLQHYQQIIDIHLAPLLFLLQSASPDPIIDDPAFDLLDSVISVINPQSL